MINKANMADRKVLVSITSVDSVYTEITTEITTQRYNVIITDGYVSIILRNSDNSVNKEIFKPWHQIKELTITEVKDDEESSNRTDT